MRITTRLGGFAVSHGFRVLRGIEKFASQAAWNNPDLIWITLLGLVDWTCNVFMPVYAVLQVIQGLMQYSRRRPPHIRRWHAWMRHFAAAALWLSLSGLVRLAEWFIGERLGRHQLGKEV